MAMARHRSSGLYGHHRQVNPGSPESLQSHCRGELFPFSIPKVVEWHFTPFDGLALARHDGLHRLLYSHHIIHDMNRQSLGVESTMVWSVLIAEAAVTSVPRRRRFLMDFGTSKP
jgi:hypothetical protein